MDCRTVPSVAISSLSFFIIFVLLLIINYYFNYWWLTRVCCKGFAFTVMNRYFDQYFARAINTSRVLRTLDPPVHYVYTTQAFLASFYLDCIDASAWQYPAPGRSPPADCRTW